jgi:hypothetical protein
MKAEEYSLTELKLQFEQKRKEARDLGNLILELEEKQELPLLKEQFEGKYFKFENSYGSEEKWNGYYFIKSISGRNEIDAIKFETDINGKTYIKNGDYYSINLIKDDTEISEEEFMEHYQKALQALSI